MFNRILIVSAAALSVSATAALAVTVSLVASSPQVSGNTADSFGAGFGGDTPVGATWSDAGGVAAPPVTIGSETNTFLSPFFDTPLENTRPYFSVGGQSATGGGPSPMTLTFATGQATFDLLWGSIGATNTLRILDDAGGLLNTFTGADILSTFALGPPTPVAALSFAAEQGESIGAVEFSNAFPAFEFALVSDVPPAVIPLPAAGSLALLALGALGALRRRKPAR